MTLLRGRGFRVSIDTFDEGEALSADAAGAELLLSLDSRNMSLAGRLRSGNVGINTAQRNMETPFGGFKMSGIGRDGGDFGLHAYTEMQSIIWPG